MASIICVMYGRTKYAPFARSALCSWSRRFIRPRITHGWFSCQVQCLSNISYTYHPHLNVLALAPKLTPRLRLRLRDLAHWDGVGATVVWTAWCARIVIHLHHRLLFAVAGNGSSNMARALWENRERPPDKPKKGHRDGPLLSRNRSIWVVLPQQNLRTFFVTFFGPLPRKNWDSVWVARTMKLWN